MATTIGRWTRYNLFATPASAVLSVVFIPWTLYAAYLGAHWMLSVAQWSVVFDNLTVLLVGTFPHEQMWRALVAGAALCALVGMTLGVVLMSGRWRGPYTVKKRRLTVSRPWFL